jgi:hypothetical protein
MPVRMLTSSSFRPLYLFPRHRHSRFRCTLPNLCLQPEIRYGPALHVHPARRAAVLGLGCDGGNLALKECPRVWVEESEELIGWEGEVGVAGSKVGEVWVGGGVCGEGTGEPGVEAGEAECVTAREAGEDSTEMKIRRGW